MTTTLRLLQAEDEEGWKAYHGIRRHVLFELRGLDFYDEVHPDEHRQGHFPLLFSVDGVPTGTARLDVSDDAEDVGIVRLVAIIPQRQGQGFGRTMMRAVETFAIARSIRRLEVYAAPDAVPFYQKQGWQHVRDTQQTVLLAKLID
jgi:GNAT superfamily N-acetyltransferase